MSSFLHMSRGSISQFVLTHSCGKLENLYVAHAIYPFTWLENWCLGCDIQTVHCWICIISRKCELYCSLHHQLFAVYYYFHRPTWERQNHVHLVSQQNSSPTYVANNSMKILNDVFIEHIISRNLWPPCLSDFSPPNFICWYKQNLS